jgi:hypothetical protein
MSTASSLANVTTPRRREGQANVITVFLFRRTLQYGHPLHWHEVSYETPAVKHTHFSCYSQKTIQKKMNINVQDSYQVHPLRAGFPGYCGFRHQRDLIAPRQSTSKQLPTNQAGGEAQCPHSSSSLSGTPATHWLRSTRRPSSTCRTNQDERHWPMRGPEVTHQTGPLCIWVSPFK